MVLLPDIIEDLGLILISAAVVMLLFKKLKQPVVLGYLVAGFFVGHHVPFFPTVKDTENIKIWGEIGVIFLLFSLGLEFSIRKLANIGKPASITAIFEIVFMLGAGFFTGKILGWSTMDSLFLGGILSISSTTIIVRAFEELNLKGKKFVSLVFGTLIVEDLIAILLLVLLSTIAVTQTVSGSEIIFSALRLGFFLILWFIVGIYLLPNLLNRIRIYLDDETTLIVAVGLCLLMVTTATHVGFSPALGAFVMGSIFAETKEGKRIEHLLVPVKDLFAAVFFISVGMLIDPKILVEEFDIVLLITAVTIIGKFIGSGLGALVSGRDLKQAVQTGLSLAQIGEFSFIIATLGLSLKVTSDFLYPIAVAVSAITTFTTPYQIKYAEHFYYWLEKKIPQDLLMRLKNYESGMSSKGRESILSILWEMYGLKVLLNSVMVGAVTLVLSQYRSENPLILLGVCLLNMLLAAPFLWAIVVGGPAGTKSLKSETVVRLEKLQLGILIIRSLLGVILSTLIVGRYYSVENYAIGVLFLLSMMGVFFIRYAEPFYRSAEKRFLANLNSAPDEDSKASKLPQLAPWDASLTEFVVSPESSLAGKTLQETKLKENYGVMVTLIERGQQKHLAPGRDEKIFPGDKLLVLGNEDRLAIVSKLFDSSPIEREQDQYKNFGLEAMLLGPRSPFLHRSIRNCGIRETVKGLIVGIERKGRRILNPSSELELQEGDLVWIVGDLNQIRRMS